MTNDRQPATIEAVRTAEMQIARQLAAARDEGSRRIVEARLAAELRVECARSEGFQQGRAERESFLAQIDEEANRILAEATAHATGLGQIEDGVIKAAAEKAVELLAGLSVRAVPPD